MSDRADRVFADAMRLSVSAECEAARLAWAAARMRHLEDMEQRLLDLAVRAADDQAACWLELCADTAWRDGRALAAEHGLEPSWAEEAP